MIWALWVTLGSLFAAVAVALGAIGSHAVKHRLSPAMFEVYETAVRYQMFHALGLFAVGFVAMRLDDSWIRAAGIAMVIGTVFFSGSLYGYVATSSRAFVMVTPVGGVLLILGWLILSYAVGRSLF